MAFGSDGGMLAAATHLELVGQLVRQLYDSFELVSTKEMMQPCLIHLRVLSLIAGRREVRERQRATLLLSTSPPLLLSTSPPRLSPHQRAHTRPAAALRMCVHGTFWRKRPWPLIACAAPQGDATRHTGTAGRRPAAQSPAEDTCLR